MSKRLLTAGQGLLAHLVLLRPAKHGRGKELASLTLEHLLGFIKYALLNVRTKSFPRHYIHFTSQVVFKEMFYFNQIEQTEGNFRIGINKNIYVACQSVFIPNGRTEQREAFAKAYELLEKRIKAFLSLPFESLEGQELENKLKEMGLSSS